MFCCFSPIPGRPSRVPTLTCSWTSVDPGWGGRGSTGLPSRFTTLLAGTYLRDAANDSLCFPFIGTASRSWDDQGSLSLPVARLPNPNHAQHATLASVLSATVHLDCSTPIRHAAEIRIDWWMTGRHADMSSERETGREHQLGRPDNPIRSSNAAAVLVISGSNQRT
jgi:hypothetical protein